MVSCHRMVVCVFILVWVQEAALCDLNSYANVNMYVPRLYDSKLCMSQDLLESLII